MKHKKDIIYTLPVSGSVGRSCTCVLTLQVIWVVTEEGYFFQNSQIQPELC